MGKHFEEEDFLNRVSVRLIGDGELERFNSLLVEKHYLHSADTGGQTMRYVAEVGEEWVGLLLFGSAAFHLKPRDQEIGWSANQRERRLNLIVNNRRFLMLTPRNRYPNLASKVLSLALRRLSSDYEKKWNHPVVGVETFVDETLYEGTCYRACGFKVLGQSAGYGRKNGDFYVKHERPKGIYWKSLEGEGVKSLKQKTLPKKYESAELSKPAKSPLLAKHYQSLFDLFSTFKDGRSKGHGMRYSTRCVLACAAVATLMGAGCFAAMESICSRFDQRILRMLRCGKNKKTNRYQAPSDSTFRKVLNSIDADEFTHRVGQWLLEQDPTLLKVLSVDGKTLRGSGRGDGISLHLLTAVTHQLSLAVAQRAVGEKTNEIPEAKTLLESIPSCVEGSLFTFDAMHTQQETARFITQDLGADYLLPLKGNQPQIEEKANRLMESGFFPST